MIDIQEKIRYLIMEFLPKEGVTKTMEALNTLFKESYEQGKQDGVQWNNPDMLEKIKEEAIINYRINFEQGIDLVIEEMAEQIKTGKSKSKGLISLEQHEKEIRESNKNVIRDVEEPDTIFLTKEDIPNADEIYSTVKQTKSMVAKRLRDKYLSTKSESNEGEGKR